MQSGELIVTGKDKAVIPLHGNPCRISCQFKHSHDVVPCNPHHEDYLEYDVHISHSHHSGYVLIIKWSVSGVREIVWHAHY